LKPPPRITSAIPSVAYWTLLALFLMNLLNYIDRFILAAVLGPVQDDLQLTDSQAGWIGSIFYLSYALFSPFVGWFGDRVPRRRLLALGVGIWSIATFGTGLCKTFEQMMVARSFLGLGEATYAILAPTLIADLFHREHRNRAITIFYLAIPFGAALGYALGGLIHSWIGWQYAFFIVGLPGVAVAVAALFLPEPRRGATEVHGDHALPMSAAVYASLLRNRSYVFNCLGMAMFTFALGGLQYWAPRFFEKARGINLAAANFWLGVVVVIAGLVGTFSGGWIADRLRDRVGGAYFFVSGMTLLASAPFILAAILATEPAVIFGSLLIGVTLAMMNIGPSNTILTNVTPPQIRAAGIAVNLLLIHALGDIPSPPLMGFTSDLTGSLFWGMTITLPAVVLGGAFFCLGAPHLERDQQRVAGGAGMTNV
jgi:MFS transporter, Spinster family, sphingosine-1-phosphate transporter